MIEGRDKSKQKKRRIDIAKKTYEEKNNEVHVSKKKTPRKK